jgi:hypothetical protein
MVRDVLISHLNLSLPLPSEANDTVLDCPTEQSLAEAFSLEEDEIPDWTSPVNCKCLRCAQQADADLLQKVCTSPGIKLHAFCVGRKSHQLLCLGAKILIPASPQEHATEYHHEVSC